MISLFLGAVAAPPFVSAGSRRLSPEIEAVLDLPAYKDAHWGILVVDLKDGTPVYELNADQLFAPASTTKLFSVACALDELGPDYRFRTPVFRRGQVDGQGVLAGDLILVASGDLSFGGRTDATGRIAFKDSDHTYANGNDAAELTDPDPLGGLDELARQVAAAGIKRVEGEILVDDRLFEEGQSTGSGPSRLTPVIINDNVIDFTLVPGPAGSPAAVDWRPRTEAYRVDAAVDTVAEGGEIRIQIQSPRNGVLTVRGQIPAGHKPLIRVSEVDDPGSFARTLFIEALRRAGVRVEAPLLALNPERSLPAVGSYVEESRVGLLTSPPFSESIRLILKVSHNLHASTLPILVAVKHGKRSLEEGLRLQREFLKGCGVAVETISFGGGAGGARADFTTPQATVQLLRHMAGRPDFAAYEAALPVLGVDGTLAKGVTAESPARGKVRAKTGTYLVDNVMNDTFLMTSKALAGYMETPGGRRLAFAFFINNAHLKRATDTARAGETLGRLCEVIYASSDYLK